MKRYAAALMILLPLFAAVPPVNKDKALGIPTAPVQIEIFSDFTCPHCKVLHETFVPQLKKDYADTGKAYIVERSFPLSGPGHEQSRPAAEYAVAASRVGKYQPVADALFKNQGSWGMSGNVWAFVSPALTPAEQKKVLSLVKDKGVADEIDADYQEGIASGINETPTLIVTAKGKRYNLPHAPDYRLLKSMIDGFLPK